MKSIRINRPFPIPADIRSALQILHQAGFTAYLVGGSVRDFILGRNPKDHDIATNATPEVLAKLFPNALEVGKAFGVLKVPIESGITLEIATFRKDLKYNDHRHPTGVEFSTPEEDAKRRDFTINALFFDVKAGQILDFSTGLEDIDAKTLRTIGEPHERFREDALRLLRAVRQSVELDFRLEERTAQAVQNHARLIQKISAERVREELERMLQSRTPERSLELLSEFGLLPFVLPEMERMKKTPSPGESLWRQTLKVVENISRQESARPIELSWAAALCQCGKPLAAERSQGKNFNGHERDASQVAGKLAERLKFSGAVADRLKKLLEDQNRFKDVFQMREATLLRFILEPHFPDLLKLHRAIATATDGNLAFHDFCEQRWFELKRSADLPDPRKIISGDDLIQLGFKPGPIFTDILRQVEDLILERKLKTQKEALEYIVKFFVH